MGFNSAFKGLNLAVR